MLSKTQNECYPCGIFVPALHTVIWRQVIT